MKTLPVVGSIVRVRASKFLGTPACKARVLKANVKRNEYLVRDVAGVGPDCYESLTIEDPRLNEYFQVDSEGYVLIGPPYKGRLVRAP